jgi:H+-translocating NAD(P) transhydrogenase subunit beta
VKEPAFTWVTQLLYVGAASCFVLGLHLMNTPATARRGNQLSTGGMVLAVVVTFALIIHDNVITATGCSAARRACTPPATWP